MAYLYGASIQGIQGYIFETNKLKEIVGASNIIEDFCSLNFLETYCNTYDVNLNKNNILRIAGGNIRIKFDEKVDAEKMVKNFSQYVMLNAYGITVSQSVISYEEKQYLQASKDLELLLKNARNRAPLPLDAKFSLMEQTGRTGKPAQKKTPAYGNNESIFDKGGHQKYEKAVPAHKNMLLEKIGIKADKYAYFPLDLSQIANTKNKIAVIHADGNKMGLLLQKMAVALENRESKEIQEVYKLFSKAIEKATKDAISNAFEKHFIVEDYDDKDKKVPFRPIIIGGDDVTVICHADKAIGFVHDYMDQFQENTKTELSSIIETYKLDDFKKGLSACAGIAYCNEKFPFHYAVDVAETLCGRAKKASSRKASCLLFHNIQGAAFTDYEQYVQNELILDNGKTRTNLEFGPYYVNNNMQPSIKALEDVYTKMNNESFPLSKLREWLSELALDNEYAKKYLERVNVMAKKDTKIDMDALNTALGKLGDITLDNLINIDKTPIHDILQLKSVQGSK